MATYITAQGNEYVAPLASDSGNVFGVFGSYSLSGLQADDIIVFVKVPRGAKVLSCCVATDGDTSGGTMNLGVLGDDDFFAADIALDGARHETIKTPVEFNMDDEQYIVGKITAAGTAMNDKTVSVTILYTLSNIA